MHFTKSTKIKQLQIIYRKKHLGWFYFFALNQRAYNISSIICTRICEIQTPSNIFYRKVN